VLIAFCDKWNIRAEGRELLASLTPLAKQQIVDEFAPKDTTRDVNNVFMKFARGKERHLQATQGGGGAAPASMTGLNPAPPPAANAQANAQAVAMQQALLMQQVQAAQYQQQYAQWAATVAQVQQAMAAQAQMNPQMVQLQMQQAAQLQQAAQQINPQVAQALQLPQAQGQTLLPQATPQLALAGTDAGAVQPVQPQLALPAPDASTSPAPFQTPTIPTMPEAQPGMTASSMTPGLAAPALMPAGDASMAQGLMTAPGAFQMPGAAMPQALPQMQMPVASQFQDFNSIQLAPQALQQPVVAGQMQPPVAQMQMQPGMSAAQMQPQVGHLQPAVAASQQLQPPVANVFGVPGSVGFPPA
jgi:hypothetical protein